MFTREGLKNLYGLDFSKITCVQVEKPLYSIDQLKDGTFRLCYSTSFFELVAKAGE